MLVSPIVGVSPAGIVSGQVNPNLSSVTSTSVVALHSRVDDPANSEIIGCWDDDFTSDSEIECVVVRFLNRPVSVDCPTLIT